MISRTHLRQFLAVVDAGNFTRAAAQINVTQPTLSAGISELEKRLGAKLFARSNRRVQLTEAGNRLLTHARAIEREFRDAEESVTGITAPLQPIRLGVLLSLSTALIERALAAYRGPEPIELSEGNDRELAGALAHGRIDLAVTLLHPGEDRRTSLFREDYYLALPANHRLAGRDRVSAAEVAGETMISRRACEVLGKTSRYFTERGVRPPFSFRSVNDDRAMAMVRAGLGITVAPRSLAGPGIAMVRLDGFDESREIGLAFTTDGRDRFTPHHPLVTALTGAMRQSVPDRSDSA